MPKVGEYWYMSYCRGHLLVYITYINKEENTVRIKILMDTDSVDNWTNRLMTISIRANLRHFDKKLSQSELTLELLE